MSQWWGYNDKWKYIEKNQTWKRWCPKATDALF